MSLMDTIKEKLNTAIDDIDLEQLKEESQKSETEEVVIDEEEVVEETEVDETEVEETEVEEDKEDEDEDETLEEAGAESQKSYVTRDEVQDMIKTGFHQISEDLSKMVDENISSSISALEESQKEALGYVTGDDVKEIFNEEFTAFKTNFEKDLAQHREESIKQFSKSIENNTTIVETPAEKPASKLFAGRDANGCRVRKQ